MKNKVSAIFMAIVMSFTLAACRGEETTAAVEEMPIEAEVEAETVEEEAVVEELIDADDVVTAEPAEEVEEIEEDEKK